MQQNAVSLSSAREASLPKRSTLFQRVVFQIQRQLADAAAVEESAMLPDHTGESEREVDVVIRSVVAGHDVIVSLECQEGSRKATVSWVEAMAMKHDALPTSKLILLSASGFTRGARSKAVSLGIELLSFEEAFESDWANLDLNALDLWALSVSGCVVGLVSTKVWFWAPEELDIFDGGGVSLGELGVVVRSAFERSIETSESAVEYAKKHDAAEFCIGCENHPPFFLKDQFGQLKLASLLYVRVKAVRAMSLSSLKMARYKSSPIAFASGPSSIGEIELSLVDLGSGVATGALSLTPPNSNRTETASIQFVKNPQKVVFVSETVRASRKPGGAA